MKRKTHKTSKSPDKNIWTTPLYNIDDTFNDLTVSVDQTAETFNLKKYRGEKITGHEITRTCLEETGTSSKLTINIDQTAETFNLKKYRGEKITGHEITRPYRPRKRPI